MRIKLKFSGNIFNTAMRKLKLICIVIALFGLLTTMAILHKLAKTSSERNTRIRQHHRYTVRKRIKPLCIPNTSLEHVKNDTDHIIEADENQVSKAISTGHFTEKSTCKFYDVTSR